MGEKKTEGDLGKHYERKIMTLIALKCLLRKDIMDFWLLTNPSEIDKFDDLILHVEYEDNRKEIFFMQLKHNQKGDRPIRVDKFTDIENKKKKNKFSLEMYSEAYASIMKKTEFFSTHKISKNTKIFFVIYNNRQVSMDSPDPANLYFESLKKEDFRTFISSKVSEDVTTEYRIKGKYTETWKKFLSQFYFYGGQLGLEHIPSEIMNLIGRNEECVNNIMKYFYDFASSENTIKKLNKLDIKTKVLLYIFGGCMPPNRRTKDYSLLTVLEKFDAILIYEKDSAEAIWNEILTYMRKYYNIDSLKLSGWEEPLPINLSSELRDSLNLRQKEQVNTKHLYFHLVAKRLLPLYIENNKKYVDIVAEKLMIKREIFTVILDSKKLLEKEAHFHMLRNKFNLKLLENVHDLDKEQYIALTSRVQVSLQGKQNIPLSNFVDDDEHLRKKISIDLLIRSLDKNVNIGSMKSEASIYIQRRLKVPVLNESILKNKKYRFIIVCGISSLEKFNSKSLDSYLSCIEKGDEEGEELDGEGKLSILTNTENFDMSLIKCIEKIPNLGPYCVLQFVYRNKDSENRFVVKETNGTLEIMKSSICEYYQMNDDQLFNSNRHLKINIICNKAGMGKTMLLNHISQKFSPSEWVVQIELGKYSDRIKEICDFEGFIMFIRNIEMETVKESNQIIFELLHQHHIEHERMVILLDDYEQINDRKLLKILNDSINKGMKIWMVGRPLIKIELEETFQVFSMELDEFNVEDQNECFRHYFSQNNSSKEVVKKIRLAEKTRSKLESSFIGICQQTMMLAELLNSSNNITADHIRIDELYEKFIDLQIDQHYSKNKRFILRILSKLAMFSFFTKNVLKNLFDWDEFDCDIDVFKEENPKAALIMEFQKNNIPQFSHKTYAEFLSAKWLADTAIKQTCKETPFDITKILELLYCPELTNVRKFFDNILTRDNTALSAVLSNDFAIGSVSNERNETDILGRTIYHMIMSYGKRYHIHTASETKQALHNYEERANFGREGQLILLRVPELDSKSTANVTKEKLLQFITPFMLFKKDDFLERTVVDYALMSGSLEELDVSIRNVQREDLFRDMTFENLCFILLHCIRNKFNRIFSELVVDPKIRKMLIQIREYQNRMSLLHVAVKYRNWNAGKKLVGINPSIESWGVDKEKNTPLHLACQHTRQNSSRTLSIFLHLDHYSTNFLNLKNSRGWSHLHYFAHQGHEEWVEKMLQNPGIQVDSACNQGNTPFILSVMKKNLGIAAILKDNGANINLGNKHKMTALHFAASKGLYECTEKLIQWGAKLSVKTSYGATPLIKASSWGQVKIVHLLLNAKANINSVDTNNWTSLHHAVKRKKFRVIQALVKRGADVNAVTNKGHTPLIIASIHNVPEAMKILTKDLSRIFLGYYLTTERGTGLNIANQKNYNECRSLIRKAVFTSTVFEQQMYRPAVGQTAAPTITYGPIGAASKIIGGGHIVNAQMDGNEDAIATSGKIEEEDYDEEDEHYDDEEEYEDSDKESYESDESEEEYDSEEYDEYEGVNEEADDEGGTYNESFTKFFSKIINFCRTFLHL